jgi:hypothetical protein
MTGAGLALTHFLMRNHVALQDLTPAPLGVTENLESSWEGQKIFEGLLGLVAMVIIAYLVAVDANKKGRSGLMWGCWSFAPA